MVQTIAASKNKTLDNNMAIMACAAVISLDSISFKRDCGFVRKQLPKSCDNFLGVAVN